MPSRTAVQIMREMALIKANTKDSPDMRAVLLAPLQQELEALVSFQKRQGELQLAAEEAAVKKGAK